MTKGKKHTNNFVDALATEMRYAVLTKRGRIQILVRPTPKQLRKRGKRGWDLQTTVDDNSSAGQVLDEVIKRTILQMEMKGESENGNEKKAKKIAVAQ